MQKNSNNYARELKKMIKALGLSREEVEAMLLEAIKRQQQEG